MVPLHRCYISQLKGELKSWCLEMRLSKQLSCKQKKYCTTITYWSKIWVVIVVMFWCSHVSQKAFILILSPQIRKWSWKKWQSMPLPVYDPSIDRDSITPRQCDRSCLGFKVQSHNDRPALSNEQLRLWADISVPCLSWPPPVFF